MPGLEVGCGNFAILSILVAAGIWMIKLNKEGLKKQPTGIIFSITKQKSF